MAEAAAALDLPCFAYLSVPRRAGDFPPLVSNYPSAWTKSYLRRRYERFDPVILRALGTPEPFEWGLGVGLHTPSDPERELFEEAAKFGIRRGFTILSIHDRRGPIAAVTFAADEQQPPFDRTIAEHARVLQLMAIYFHAHARQKISSARIIGGVSLSPRELECLEWVARRKVGLGNRSHSRHLASHRSLSSRQCQGKIRRSLHLSSRRSAGYVETDDGRSNSLAHPVHLHRMPLRGNSLPMLNMQQSRKRS